MMQSMQHALLLMASQFISNSGTQKHGHHSNGVMRRCRGGRCHCRAFLCGLLGRSALSLQLAPADGSHCMPGQATPEFWTRVLHPGFMCPHFCHRVGHVPSSSFLRVGILAAPSLQLTAREREYYVFVKLQFSCPLPGPACRPDITEGFKIYRGIDSTSEVLEGSTCVPTWCGEHSQSRNAQFRAGHVMEVPVKCRTAFSSAGSLPSTIHAAAGCS